MKSLWAFGSSPHLSRPCPARRRTGRRWHERVQAQQRLVARAGRVRGRVEEVRHPGEPVGLDDRQDPATATAARPSSAPKTRPGGRPSRAGRTAPSKQSMVPRSLQHDHGGHQRGHREQRHRQLPGVAEQPFLADQHVGAPQRERELGQLGRLHLDRAEIQPALGAVEVEPDAGHQHRGQQDQAEQQQRVRRAPVGLRRQPQAEPERRRPRGAQITCRGEDRVGAAGLGVRLHPGGREHHDQPDAPSSSPVLDEAAGAARSAAGPGTRRSGPPARAGACAVAVTAAPATAAANASPRAA